MSQPNWKYAGHIGDVDPIAYGGGFVYIDETGKYAPEMIWLEPASDDEWKLKQDQAQLQMYRIVLDPPRFKTLTAVGQRQMVRPLEMPMSERHITWNWHQEWYVKKLPDVANSCGISVMLLLRSLLGNNPLSRAQAYSELISYFGAHEFDSYPVTMTENEAYQKYASEMAEIRKPA